VQVLVLCACSCCNTLDPEYPRTSRIRNTQERHVAVPCVHACMQMYTDELTQCSCPDFLPQWHQSQDFGDAKEAAAERKPRSPITVRPRTVCPLIALPTFTTTTPSTILTTSRLLRSTCGQQKVILDQQGVRDAWGLAPSKKWKEFDKMLSRQAPTIRLAVASVASHFVCVYVSVRPPVFLHRN